MKKYISVSENRLKSIADNLEFTISSIRRIENELNQVQSIIDLTDKEKTILKITKELLSEKMNKLDDILEDENNQFYSIENTTDNC